MKHLSERKKGIKIDHDSDCAVHNEPALKNGLCDCGLIPKCVNGIKKYLEDYGSFTHEGEKQSIVDAFQAGYNFKSRLGSDTEILLEEFKEIQPEYFDVYNTAYTKHIPQEFIMELMLHLINKLEEHIKQQDNSDWAF